ncbi:hypothetical protein HG537_0A08050 [Torulaspora globosa]|uniref:Uncharacterized protein n=1 Tax=Torulaspora globosa TaxID=48254 RepID=A0A7H9HL59_9SACH|nr:hypothetical protein HG537_0A08050 [Torulaspora sp. CBS 2947]
MSMLRSLQHQPKVISLFSHNLENSKAAEAILQVLKCDAGEKYNVELDTKFPTLDQLKYMNSINPNVLRAQIPRLSELLERQSHDSVFHSELKECVARGYWSGKHPLWVDWEERKMGNDVESIRKLLEPQNNM